MLAREGKGGDEEEDKDFARWQDNFMLRSFDHNTVLRYAIQLRVEWWEMLKLNLMKKKEKKIQDWNQIRALSPAMSDILGIKFMNAEIPCTCFEWIPSLGQLSIHTQLT